jgi:putative ABC transport system permease protein
MSTLLHDLRYAIRMLVKQPGFTFIAVVTLALGIGANTALFSVIDAVLLRPLPFRDPAWLVAVNSIRPEDPTGSGEISYPNFLDWRAQSHSFEGLSVWTTNNFTYQGGSQPESVPGAVISGNLFSMLGVPPFLGASLTPEQDQPREQLPVMLSFEFWQSHFGGDRDVIGRAITLDNHKYAVAGVMPPRFQFPVQSERVELWTTIAHDLGKGDVATQRGAAYLQVIGRLKPGIQIPQARADVALIQERLNHQYPENRPKAVAIQSEADQVTGALRPALLILLGAVGIVLLVACANVANLLLARATARQKEFTVRSALGASRWMIVRQLLTESVLLSMAGAVLGMMLAYWVTDALVRMAPADLARTSDIALDFRVLGFAFLTALITGVLFGLVPALHVVRSDLARPLGESGRGSSVGPAGARVRSTLVVAQLAVAFVLLIGAGLLLRSFNRLLHVDPGFRADHVLTFVLEVPEHRHASAPSVFVRDVLQSTRAMPGVASASAIFGLPLGENQNVFTGLAIEGHPMPASQRPRVAFRIIESDYFRAMGIGLMHGRAFTPGDEQGKRPLAIVNEAFVRQILQGENPMGQRIQPQISFGDGQDAPMREIVGVVADVKSGSISKDAVPEVYAPQTPTDFMGEMTIVVRTQNDPTTLVPQLRTLVASMDKDIPLRDVKTLDQYVSTSISAPRFETLLLGTFAALACVLTAIGLYGVISYSVAQRNREMGIRVALGAQRGSILRMVVREGASLALIGTGTGLAASFFAVRLIRGLLFGTGITDPATFIAVPLVMIVIALLASYIPARRATLVDPMVVLREE